MNAARTAPIRPLPVPDIPNGLWLLVDGPAACHTVDADCAPGHRASWPPLVLAANISVRKLLAAANERLSADGS